MQRISLAVDVQGGDLNTALLVSAVLKAVRKSSTPVELFLCGDKGLIQKALAEELKENYPWVDLLNIEDCPEKVSVEDIPARAWKKRQRSPIVRAISLQAEGRVSASLSAGDTRILMGASVFILGREEGIRRPALASLIPSRSGKPVLLLDIGANLDCRSEQLVDFAILGLKHYKHHFSAENVSAKLLNVGIEASKGTRAIQEANLFLQNNCSQYAGFIEGDEILTGETEVIVCDGFVGNVLLKSFESFYELAESVVDSGLIMDALKERMTILNRENYGAAPLLGLKGTVFKAHGASTPVAFENAVSASLKAAQVFE